MSTLDAKRGAPKRRRPRLAGPGRGRLTAAERAATYPRWRPLKIPERAHPLVKRLWREINDQRTTLTTVAQRAGLARQSMQAWAHRTAPNLACIEAAFGVLGLRLKVVADD